MILHFLRCCSLFSLAALLFSGFTSNAKAAGEATKATDPLAALEQDARVTRRFTLDNGLTFLIKEDHSAPLAAIQIWVGVGSSQEGVFLGSGLAHFIEHMIFKGTPTRKVGDITKAINDAGGSINAFTSFDRTAFVVDIPSSAWRMGLETLADAVLNASFPEDEYEKEREVILRELAMNRDNPDREISRLLFQTAYRVHPLRVPIIGYKEILLQRTHQDLLDFHKAWFGPNNMIVSMVGDFSTTEAEQAVREIFEPIPRRMPPSIPLPAEPAQISARVTRNTGNYEIGRLALGYHAVALDSPDAPALDVLAAIVGEGESSRLAKDIKDKRRLALSIGAWTYFPGEPGLFGITAAFEPEKETELVAAIQEQVQAWRKMLFTREELNKARRQVLSAMIGQLQTASGMAYSLASDEFYTGDFAYNLTYLRNLEELSLETLRNVADRYLRPENSSLVILSPLPSQETQESSLASAAPVVRRELSTGLPLLLREDKRLPLVHICVVAGGGLLAERKNEAGSCNLMSELLLRGTTDHTAEEIAEIVESAGALLSAFSGYNSFGLQASCLSMDTPMMLELVAECLTKPAFPEEEVEKQKTLQANALRRRLESPMAIAEDALRGALFPNHPYRFNSLGDPACLPDIKRKAILALHARTMVAGNVVLAIFGDIEPEKVADMAERAFRRIPKGVKPAPEHAPAAPNLPARLLTKEPKEQAVIMMGFPGIAVKDPRSDSLELLLAAMNGLSSELMLSIREERGLAYYAGVYQQIGLDPGLLVIYAGARSDKMQEVEELIEAERKRVTTAGLRPDEFKRARQRLLASHQRSLQSNSDIAMNCALDELCGLGYNCSFELEKRLATLTPEIVRNAAASLLLTNSVAVSIVLPMSSETSESEAVQTTEQETEK